MSSIGSRIRLAREALDITQEQLGKLCGTTKQTIFKYECGIVSNIPLDRLEALAHHLQTTPAYLLGWTDNKEAASLYISANTAERIKLLAKAKGIAVKDMLEECELNKNALSTMLSRGSWLQANNLAKIADYLECSVDYLLGRTEKIPADQSVSGLTKERQALIDLIMACPEELAKDLLTAMQLFLQNWQR